MLEAHRPYIDEAGRQGVQMLCFQEIFTGPYVCPSQDARGYAAAEAIPDGPTTRLMREYAKKYSMVIWIDNQYAAYTPEGKIGFGVLQNPEPAWLEIKNIEVK